MTSTLLPIPALPRLNAPTIRKLPNGLTIVAEQIPVEAVSLNLWFKVGSSVESNEINGMAHFLEHMVFKGTDRLQAGEFERYIEESGAVTNAAYGEIVKIDLGIASIRVRVSEFKYLSSSIRV